LDLKLVRARAFFLAGVDYQLTASLDANAREARAARDKDHPLDGPRDEGDMAATSKLDRIEMRQRNDLGCKCRSGDRENDCEEGKDRADHEKLL
jgi:hypothetical protein